MTIATSTDFAAELARFGPERTARRAPFTLSRARSYCNVYSRRHAENFSVASMLLPRQLVPHFHAVYAYCRWADDLADEAGGGAQALALLRWWRQELLACYAGRPRHPVMVALRDTIERFEIPKEPFLDLLFAFEQDQLVKRYRNFEQLLDYCRYSANPVGRLVLYLCGAFDERRAALADQICTGLQLANFWQDVSRDLAINRVYLPSDDRERFGYSDTDLHQRRYTPAFKELLKYEIERTRDFFYRGLPLTEQLPPAVAGDIELFVNGGLAILRKIERLRYNVWRRRPKLGSWEKGVLVGGVVWRRLGAQVRRVGSLQ